MWKKDDFEALCQRNLKALRSAETELQNTEEQHAEATEVAGPKPDLDDTAEKDDFEASFYKEF